MKSGLFRCYLRKYFFVVHWNRVKCSLSLTPSCSSTFYFYGAQAHRSCFASHTDMPIIRGENIPVTSTKSQAQNNLFIFLILPQTFVIPGFPRRTAHHNGKYHTQTPYTNSLILQVEVSFSLHFTSEMLCGHLYCSTSNWYIPLLIYSDVQGRRGGIFFS